MDSNRIEKERKCILKQKSQIGKLSTTHSTAVVILFVLFVFSFFCEVKERFVECFSTLEFQNCIFEKHMLITFHDCTYLGQLCNLTNFITAS